MKISNILKEEL